MKPLASKVQIQGTYLQVSTSIYKYLQVFTCTLLADKLHGQQEPQHKWLRFA